MKTFLEICEEENIIIPTDLLTARRLQRVCLNPNFSIDFVLNLKSEKLLRESIPLENMNRVFVKKMAENIIITHRLKHRRTDITKLELMSKKSYHYRNSSFYYSKESVNNRDKNE